MVEPDSTVAFRAHSGGASDFPLHVNLSSLCCLQGSVLHTWPFCREAPATSPLGPPPAPTALC